MSSSVFKYLVEHFTHISDTKIKASVFVGAQIRELMKNDEFDRTLAEHERGAWIAFKLLVGNFFGNTRSSAYEQMVSRW